MDLFQINLCAFLCVIKFCGISNGGVIYQQQVNRLNTRIARSPLTYVADENGQRVIIITLKSPKQSGHVFNNYDSGTGSFNNNAFGGPIAQMNGPNNNDTPNRFSNNLNANNYPANYNQQPGFSSNSNNNLGFINQASGTFNNPPRKLYTKPETVIYPTKDNNNNIASNRRPFPGALEIIELLKGLGIPFLDTPTTSTTESPVFGFPSGGIGPGPVGQDASAVEGASFGALDYALVQGGFRDKKKKQ